MKIHFLASAALSLALVAPIPAFAQADVTATQTAPAHISEAEAIKRANRLIKQMTVEEKIGQISQRFDIASLFPTGTTMPPGMPPITPLDSEVSSGRLGSILFVHDAKVANKYQRMAMEETRLKIPLMLGYDVIHGMKTMFPVPLANAASFDPAGVEAIQTIAAKEARAIGIHWTFAPMIDIARDPRWGRIVDGAGEDPYLGSAMARAQVKGFQGDGSAHRDASSRGRNIMSAMAHRWAGAIMTRYFCPTANSTMSICRRSRPRLTPVLAIS